MFPTQIAQTDPKELPGPAHPGQGPGSFVRPMISQQHLV